MAGIHEGQRLDLKTYWSDTRDVAVSFAFLLPLMLAYEVGIVLNGGDFRNAAELILKDLFGLLGAAAPWLSHFLFLLILAVAVELFQRRVQVVRLYPLLLIESVLGACLLAPAVHVFIRGIGLRHPGEITEPEHLLLSLGAGIYEELIFRLLLFAGGFSLMHRGLQLPRSLSFGVALVASAALFSLYHHAGPYGEPLGIEPLLFRFGAGILLGLVFAARGLALCVYLHTFYDLLLDLRIFGHLP